MKKLFIIVFSIFLLTGCGLFQDTPTKATEKLFKKYQNLDEAVLSDLELSSEASKLSSEKQKEDYMKAMKMQYSDLKYEIEEENVDGDEAIVSVKISVYDFYKAQKDADDYLANNSDKFLTDGVYDKDKFMEYKLKSMLNQDERVDYTISLNLSKKDDKWVVDDLDKSTLQKIHGTYNYEER